MERLAAKATGETQVADNNGEAPALLFGEKVDQLRENLEANAYYALWALYALNPRSEPRSLRRARLSLDRSLSRPGDRRLPPGPEEGRPALRLLREPGDS